MKNYLKYFPLFILWYLLSSAGCNDLITYEELGNDYTHSEEASISYIYKDGNIVIPGFVVSYEYNDKFITAVQRDLKLSKEQETLEDEEIRSIIYENGKDYYWIIQLKNDSIYGPLNHYSFKKQCEALHISKELTFNL